MYYDEARIEKIENGYLVYSTYPNIAHNDKLRYFESIDDNYAQDSKAILSWLDENDLELNFENLLLYLDSISTRVAPKTFNKRVAAIRHRLKTALVLSCQIMSNIMSSRFLSRSFLKTKAV